MRSEIERMMGALEGSIYSGHFDDLIGFEPRLALIDRNRPIEQQIVTLLAFPMCIPNDTRGQPSYRTAPIPKTS